MAKRDQYTKTKKMIVSSRSLFGRKSEMEKQIEKWEGLGWTVTHNRQIKGNKNKHELTFEYQMSEDEIATQKKQENRFRLGCGVVVILFIVYNVATSAFNNAREAQAVAPTQTAMAILARTQVAQANATTEQRSINETATATLWTPTFTLTSTFTPTLTNTPTITSTPSNTFTPTVTFTPSLTFTPSITPTVTPSPTITDTPKPSSTPIPRTPTPKPATNTPPETYYTTGNVNVRKCPKTTCDIVTTLPAGSSVSIIGAEQGDTFSGSTVWRRTIISGQEGYIHSVLLSISPPAPKPIQAQSQPAAQQPIVQQPGLVSTVPPAPVSFVPNCSGEVYDCKDLTCSQMAIYWAACPGDPSGLDGNDNDGKYCESKCGG